LGGLFDGYQPGLFCAPNYTLVVLVSTNRGRQYNEQYQETKMLKECSMSMLTIYLRGFLCIVTLAFVSGCASDPEPLEVSEVEVVEATVTAVDVERRYVSLQGPDGNDMSFYVQPEVQNLAQVSAGDKLRVSYTRALIASLTEPGQASSEVPVAAAVARSAEGEMPALTAAAIVSGTVEVISIGADGTTLTFRGPAGELRSVDVEKEASRAFVRKLSPGDQVDMTYSEAVAVEIERVD